MLQEGKSRKDIAKAIGVSTSTISRELHKNCDLRNGVYNYDLAQRKYETRLKFRGRKPVFTKEMKNTVISLLEEGYSPEFGARPLKRVIQRKLETPLARRILEQGLGPGETVVF